MLRFVFDRGFPWGYPHGAIIMKEFHDEDHTVIRWHP